MKILQSGLRCSIHAPLIRRCGFFLNKSVHFTTEYNHKFGQKRKKRKKVTYLHKPNTTTVDILWCFLSIVYPVCGFLFSHIYRQLQLQFLIPCYFGDPGSVIEYIFVKCSTCFPTLGMENCNSLFPFYLKVKAWAILMSWPVWTLVFEFRVRWKRLHEGKQKEKSETLQNFYLCRYKHTY